MARKVKRKVSGKKKGQAFIKKVAKEWKTYKRKNPNTRMKYQSFVKSKAKK